MRLWRLAVWPVALAGAVAAGYGSYITATWLRFGRPAPPSPDERDALLDQLMPAYDVSERHHVRVSASASATLAAARETDLRRSAIIRGIFGAREWLLNATPEEASRPTGLVALTTSLGWRMVAEIPGREVVYGAVTQPWKANVVFRGLAAEEFKKFREPGFVKILWTLRVDPTTPSECVFRTETRVATTDDDARRRFRWYWSRFSPGIVLIRQIALRLLKKQAEGSQRTLTLRDRETLPAPPDRG